MVLRYTASIFCDLSRSIDTRTRPDMAQKRSFEDIQRMACDRHAYVVHGQTIPMIGLAISFAACNAIAFPSYRFRAGVLRISNICSVCSQTLLKSIWVLSPDWMAHSFAAIARHLRLGHGAILICRSFSISPSYCTTSLLLPHYVGEKC